MITYLSYFQVRQSIDFVPIYVLKFISPIINNANAKELETFIGTKSFILILLNRKFLKKKINKPNSINKKKLYKK